MLPEPKTLDSLGRSWRFAPPVDDGKPFVLTPAGYKVLELCDDHGPLPTSYLWHHVRDLRKDETGFKKWLRRAYIRHNTPDGGAYITRPKEQKHAYRADRQDLSHDITEYGRKALVRKGLTLHPKRIDHMHHRFMGSCITASLRFAAEDAGIGFVRFKDIMDRHTFPSARREDRNPLSCQTSHGMLVPDDINALAYPAEDGKRKYLFIAWEFDRATESLTLIRQKLIWYLDVIKNTRHINAWGIPQLSVAIVTTAPRRMRNIMHELQVLTKKEPHLREHFLFKTKAIFDEEWIVPPIMTDVLTDPWERADLPAFLLSKP